MFKPAPLILACLMCLHAPVGQTAEPMSTSSAQDVLAARIDAAIAAAYRTGEPGAVVLVTKEGKTVFRKAYGEADVVTHAPLTAEMTMPIGSMTKQFTAVAVMLLAESGKLSTADAITRYLPDYPTQGKAITIEHLLTHSSGIPDYTSAPDWHANMAQHVSTRELMARFSRLPPGFAPGARFAYSNSNYILLGAIIEKVSALPYEKFVEQRIFTPLGMRDTAFAGSKRATTSLAAGHVVNERGFMHSDPVSPSQLYAAGGIVSTVDDLARWNAAISDGKLLSAAGWKKMFTPYRPDDGGSEYGYGFQISQWQNTTTIRHGGRIDGFESFAMRLPEHGLYVAVLSNRDIGRTPPYQIAQKIALVAMGKELAGASVAIDNQLFDTYVGRYHMTPLPIFIDISRSGDKYFAAATGQGAPFELKAVSETRFLSEAAGAELQFEKNDDGTVDRFVLLQGPSRTIAIRVAGPAMR